MRTLPLTVALLLGATLASTAQVTVEVVVDQAQFLRDEPLPVKVRVTNRSGRTLHLGQDNEWLAFAIESLDGAVVGRLAQPQVSGAFTLESAQVATRLVDLMPCFDLSQPGRYTVVATVKIKELNDEVEGKPKPFEVIRGTRLWEQAFGLPASGGPPEVRKYVLQQASYRKELKLYLRLTDADEQKVFRVFPLGPLVSFSQPEAQVDKAGYLHVLCQTGARSFLFYVISPDGEVVQRQTHDYAATRPVLRSTDDGRIIVAGGARRVTAGDVPTPLTGGGTISTNLSNPPRTTNQAGDVRKDNDARIPKK
jgi:hypothetical protein